MLESPLNTLDIDIVLTNDPVDLEQLSNIMIQGTQIGFEKYNILFDIVHWNMIPNFYPESRVVKKLVFCNEIIKNGKTITDWTDGEKLVENLWEIERVMPNPKQQKRVDAGHTFNMPICLN